MSEFEQLIAKSKADLAAIAVSFGDFSQEEASKKSKDELTAAIMRISVDEVKNLKAGLKKSKEAPKEAAPEAEPAEAAEEKPKAEKKTKASSSRKTKKTASKEEPKQVSIEEIGAEADAPASEEKAPEVKEEAPAKKKRTKKTPAKEQSKEQTKEGPGEEAKEVKEDVKEEAKEAPEASKEDKTAAQAKAKSKSSGRGRKKTSKGAETAVPASESETAKKEEASEEKAPEAASAKEEKPASKAGKKRRISFGPSQEIKEVEITKEEAEAENAEQPAPAPEIQYIEIEGILSIGGGDNKNDFCGFIHRNNYLPGEGDAYVPGQMIKRMGLRRGDKITGLALPPKGKEKYAPLRKITAVNGIEINDESDYEKTRKRPRFESLTAIYPDERLTLETKAEDLSTRIIDLFCPIGKGQRGMIVSPPKAGKTILLKKVANSITANNPNCKVIVLLIDERPEEVTDMQRSIKGEVVYSTFDKRPENHVRVTELVLERAMRLVELGEDVVILLDSMTRLARAYNLTINPTGRTLSGGLDPGSLYGPKRFFGAARNIEFGGSLTIIATALIETGSRMDEVIFEEFKGTGNMEVVLDRKLADRRVYPAIAVDKSGTRREDLLLSSEELESVWLTRKAMAEVDTIAATEAVLSYLKRTASNASFVLSAKKSFSTDS